jgi:hypothetical protein
VRGVTRESTSSKTRFTVAQVDAMRAKLIEAAAAPVIAPKASTKMGAVAALAPELLGLRRKGWGLEALAAMLGQSGLQITAGTLKNYLQRAGATRTKRRRDPERAVSSTPPAARTTPPAEEPSAATPASPLVARPVSAARVAPPGSFLVREDRDL